MRKAARGAMRITAGRAAARREQAIEAIVSKCNGRGEDPTNLRMTMTGERGEKCFSLAMEFLEK